MQKYIETFLKSIRILDLIDDNNWYEVFKAAYKDGFIGRDYELLVEAFIEADIYSDDAEDARKNLAIELFNKDLVGYNDVSLKDIVWRQNQHQWIGYTESEIFDIIKYAEANGKIKTHNLNSDEVFIRI